MKTSNFLRSKKKTFVLFFIDFSLIVISGILALFIRFGFEFDDIKKYGLSVVYFVFFTVLSYIFNGSYKVIWRYATNKDYLIIARSSFLGYLFTVLFLHFTQLTVLPRSVGMLAFMGSFVSTILSRILYQYFYEINKTITKRIIILGTDKKSVALLREINSSGYGKVVAFFDNEPSNIGRKISGITVYGPIKDIITFLQNNEIDEIIVAESVSKDIIKEIVEKVETNRPKIKIAPDLGDFFEHQLLLKDLRDLTIKDLIGREEVSIDLRSIGEYLSGRRIIVTGAGGSIGSEIVRQIMKFSPAIVLLVGRGENSVYEMYNELKEQEYNAEIVPVICDITDEKAMRHLFEKYNPSIVFHAAAHKHVFFMQNNLYEALRVNTLGTALLSDLAKEYEIERFVFISTDKSVNPTSYMGLSKRLAELYLLSNGNTKTKFAIVRFGNVIGSRGSVLHKFKKQIEEGKPVTITDPRMKRYWMTIPEAVSLVLQAGAFSNDKDLFVLDMGEQISVEQVARTLAKLMGKEIKIEYTGVIPGEKFEEELFYNFEFPAKTEHPKVMKLSFDLNLPSKLEIIDTIKESMRLWIEGKYRESEKILEEKFGEYIRNN